MLKDWKCVHLHRVRGVGGEGDRREEGRLAMAVERAREDSNVVGVGEEEIIESSLRLEEDCVELSWRCDVLHQQS
jgi:hypothetical protein